MFYTLECYAVIALTYVFIHCNFLICCWLLHIFRHAGDDDYSGDHDDYIRRGDDDCRSADIRSVLLLASSHAHTVV